MRPAVGLLLVLLVAGAQARTSCDPRAIPDDAWMVFSIPDLAAAWKPFSETPLYQETARSLRSPAITSLPGYGRLVAGQRRIEAALGYPLTTETLTQIVGGFDLVFLPPSRRDGVPLTACIVRVADPPRFRRLVHYITKHMTGATSATESVRWPKYRGVEIVSSGTDNGLALAELAPDRFVFGRRPAAVHRIIDQIRKPTGLADDARFQGAVGGLLETNPHGFLYVNSQRARSAMRESDPSSLVLSKIVHSFGTDITLAAAFRIDKQAIQFESFVPFSEPTKGRLALIYQHHKPGHLHALDLVSSAPLLVTARNTLDGLAFFDALRQLALSSMRSTLPAGKTPEREFERAKAEFREKMGFDLHDDLAAAVGPGFFLSFEDLRFDPLVPLPMFDMVAGVEVRDAKRMDKVLEGFETFLAKRLGPPGDGDRARGFQIAEHRGKPIRWFPLPRAPLYSVSYGQSGDYLVVGLGREIVEHAMDLADAKDQGFAAGRLYGALRPHLHEQMNEVFVLNVEKIVAVGREILRRLAKDESARTNNAKRVDYLLQGLGPVMAVGASTAGSEDGLHARGAVVFRPPVAKRSPQR